MGSACALRLRYSHDLFLIDLDESRLEEQARYLRTAGAEVVGIAKCDIAEGSGITEVARSVAETGRFGALVHTAGVSPGLAGWTEIINVNLVGTARLLDAFLPLASKGGIAICLGSMAAYMCPNDPALDRLIDEPLQDDFTEKLKAAISQLSERLYLNPTDLHLAYALAKRGVLRRCEQQVGLWAARGSRLVSISPGLIDTPMGRLEVEQNSQAERLLAITPLQRWGAPSDIANAVGFLISEEAGFITGCDLRIDGGLTAIIR